MNRKKVSLLTLLFVLLFSNGCGALVETQNPTAAETFYAKPVLIPGTISFFRQQTLLYSRQPLTIRQTWGAVPFASRYVVVLQNVGTGRTVYTAKVKPRLWAKTVSADIFLPLTAPTTFFDLQVIAEDKLGRIIASGKQRLCVIAGDTSTWIEMNYFKKSTGPKKGRRSQTSLRISSHHSNSTP